MNIENIHPGDYIIIVGPKAPNECDFDRPADWIQARRSHAMAAAYHGEPLFVQAIQVPFLRTLRECGEVLYVDWRDVKIVKANLDYVGVSDVDYAPWTPLANHLPDSIAWTTKQAGITTVGELAEWDRQDLLKLPGVGPATVERLSQLVAAAGLELKGESE